MILAKVHTTPKQRDEFRLLIAIRFASLMALAKSNNEPIECPRVQTRVAELEKYLAHNHPSQLFISQFENQAGELGDNLAMRYNHHTGRITIWRNTPLHQSGKVFQLRASV